MGRTDEPIIPFIKRCVDRTFDRKEAYKGFKIQSLVLATGIRILIMAILSPYKKKNFDDAFEDLFKDYESYRKRVYEGYAKKYNLRTTINKNKKRFQVLFNDHGIFIFRERLNCDFEQSMIEFSNIKSPYPKTTPGTDRIEDFYEKVMREVIFPKFLSKFSDAYVETIQERIDLNSSSSSYEHSTGSPFTLSSDSPDLSELQANSLSGGTVAQNFGEPIPFDNQESMDFEESQSLEEFQRNVNNLISENIIGDNKKIPFVENPEYDKVNNIESIEAACVDIHQIPGQNIIWYQVLIPVVFSTTNNSDRYSDPQYADSCSGVFEENCTMTPTGNFDPQDTYSYDGVLEDNPTMSPTENLGTNTNYDFITTNFSEKNSSIPYTEGKESKLILDPQDTDSCNGVLEDNPIVIPTENLRTNMNYDLISINFPEKNSSVPYTEGKENKLILDPQDTDSCNGILEDNPIAIPTENLGTNMNYDLISINFSEKNSSVPYTEGKENKLILDPQDTDSCYEVLENNSTATLTENRGTNMYYDLISPNFSEKNSCIPYTEGKENKLILDPQDTDSCNEVLEDNPTATLTENLGTYMHYDLITPNFSEKNSSVPYTEGKENRLILGVVSEAELFQKHSSMTKNTIQVTNENHPSITEFSVVGFEVLEEMEAEPGASFNESTIMTADNWVKNLHDPSNDKHGSTYYQMFGVLNTDCLNNQRA